MTVNKVQLIGRLGRDPEVRYMPNGDAVCHFSIATEEQWKDRDGNRQTRTEWHSIVLYRKLGEIAGQYLRKGGLVYIEGRIQSRKYTGKDGVERTAYEIIGNEMKMLGSKELGVKAANRPTEEAQPQATPPAMPPAGGQSSQRPAPVPVDDIDDDIPF